MKITLLLLLVGLFSCDTAMSQSIVVNRSNLNALLGASRVDEGFESIGIPDGGAFGGGPRITSTNSDFGTEVIVSGITIESVSVNNSFIEWNGNNTAGTITHTIAGGDNLTVTFWQPTLAFGVDLKDFGVPPASARCSVAGITVYGADNLTVLYSGSLGMASPNAAVGVFFGYENPGGIGSVVFNNLAGGDLSFSPMIDNLSFGVVPEPSVLAFGLLGLGALAFRFRKM